MARLPQRPLQLIPAGRRALLLLITVGQLPLWRRAGGKDRPWRGREGRVFPCASGYCKRMVSKRRTYCPSCKKRLEAGLPLDLDDYVTESEWRALAKRMPGKSFV